MAGGRARRWCFTIFDGADQWSHESIVSSGNADLRFIVYQREFAPSTGRLHVQGYVEVRKAYRLQGIKRLLSCSTASCRPARGTSEDNIRYCTAEFNDDGSRKRAEATETLDPGPFRWGTPAQEAQGERKDLTEVKTVLDETKSLLALANHDFGAFLRFGRMAKEYLGLIDTPPPFRKVMTYWISGPTSTGKSRWLYESYGQEEIFSWSTRKPPWFDGYHYHKVLLIDDLEKDEIPIGYLLRLLDHYPFTLPIKGGHVQAHWTTVCVITNLDFEEIFPSLTTPPSQVAALKARIAFFGLKSSLESEMVLTKNVPSRVFPS